MNYKKRILYYLNGEKKKIILALFLVLVFVVSSVLIPFFTGKALDEISNYIGHWTDPNLFPNSGSYNQLLIYIFIIIGLLLIATVFEYLFVSIISITSERIVKNIKDDVFIKLNKVPLSYIDSHYHGDLVSRCINDCDNISTALVGFLSQFLQGILTILITIVFMFWINWILGLTILVLTPLGFVVSYFVAKHSHDKYREQVKVEGLISADVLEKFSNLEVLKSFNYEDRSFEDFKKINLESYKAGQKALFLSSLTNPSTRIINNTTYAIVGLIGAVLCVLAFNNPPSYTILGATSTIGVLSSFLQYANQFAKPFNEMSSVTGEIQQGLASIKRINDVLNEKNDIDEGKTKLIKPIENMLFSHIYFNYVPSKPLIENFNLSIDKSMKVAIVGPTGCGKTTMINLLLRFYDPQKGKFIFNGINSLEIKKSDLRSNFGLVLQDTWIFKGTIYDNIAYSKDNATKEEVIQASKEANAYNFITRLPDGFDTIIDQYSGLSQGQKQLITIARVMLLKPDIVILDEATSSIDTRSEVKINEAFDKLMKGRTSIVIAHRLSTIINSDLIIVMNEGHIIETGKHQELLDKKDFYYRLFNAQFIKE